MHAKIVFRFFCRQKMRAVLERLPGASVIFPVLLCISCASYPVAPHEGRASGALNKQDQSHQPSSSPQCKPLSEGLYVVQAGAFKNIAYAQNLRKNLEDKGYESYITVSGFDEQKRIFRVLVGRFADMKQAQLFSEEMKKKGNPDVIVAMKPPKDKFVVQAGCFSEMAQAKALRKKLEDYGYNAYITHSGTGKDKQYNVLLGEFLDRAEAERVSAQIREKEKIQVFINTI
jgi:cell division septation protein DedD